MKPHFYPQQPAPPSYVWAVVMMALIGAGLVSIVLYLRPEADPLVVIGGVSAMMVPTIAGVLSYMKSQETHRNVNSRLDAWMAASSKLARAEGVAQGGADEADRARIEREGRHID